MAWQSAETLQDSINMYDCAFNVYKELGDYKQALDEYQKLYDITDDTVRSALQQPLIETQRDYFYSQSENHALKLRSNRILLICCIIIAVLALILITVYYRYQLVKKQRKLDGYINLHQELNEMISIKDDEIDNINAQVAKLFSNHYDLLNQLCKIYYENPGSSRAGAIYTKVSSEIESFRSDKKFYDRLEQIVNEYNDDVIKKFKDGMPQLSASEYRLFCFFCAGFSPKSISVFIDEPLTHIYVKKMRLKDKILKKKPLYWHEIVECLE